MAKKKDKVKRGFGMYLFLFLLTIVCLFVVWVIVMMFLPNRVILGLQHYSYSKEETVETVSGTPLDLSLTNKIVVNADASSVLVQKADVEKDSIKFINKSSGFATKDENVEYKYEVKYSGGVLTINSTAAQGFLSFSNNTQIIIQLPLTSTYKFENTQFDISTGSGSVIFGNISTKDGSDASLNMDNVTISTESGNIRITKFVDNTFTNLSLSTKSGSFTNDHADIASRNIKLATENGKFTFNRLTHLEYGRVEANLGNGKLIANEIDGSLSFVAKDASIEVGTITQDLIGNETRDTINKSNIRVDKVSRDISLPFAKDSNIIVKEVAGEVNIETTGGNVTIGDSSLKTGLSKTSWIKTQSGKIDVKITDNINLKHNFASNNGDIVLTYLTPLNSQNTVVSNTGNVTVYVDSEYQFKLTLKDSAGQLYEKLGGKITIDLVADNFTNPLLVNKYTGTDRLLDIYTDGNISAKLI